MKYQSGYVHQGRIPCFHGFCISSVQAGHCWDTLGEWDVVWILWEEQVDRLRRTGLRKTFFSKKRKKEWLLLVAVQAIECLVVLLLSRYHRMTSCKFLMDSELSCFLFLSSFPKRLLEIALPSHVGSQFLQPSSTVRIIQVKTVTKIRRCYQFGFLLLVNLRKRDLGFLCGDIRSVTFSVISESSCTWMRCNQGSGIFF